MKVTCTRRLHASIGHRVMGHEGCCAYPHGHNYYFEVTAEAAIDERDPAPPALDRVGRVVDFSVLKGCVGGWINEWWDHGFIHHQDDKASIAMLDAFEGAALRLRGDGMANGNRDEVIRYSTPPAKRFALPYNPTAENLARYLLEEVCPRLLRGGAVRVTSVVCRETDNCSAEASL